MGRRAGLGRTGLPGSWCASWRVIRTSNAYVFRDPKPGLRGGFLCKSENPIGTLDQEILSPEPAPARDPNSPLERGLGTAFGSKEDHIENAAGSAGAT